MRLEKTNIQYSIIENRIAELEDKGIIPKDASYDVFVFIKDRYNTLSYDEEWLEENSLFYEAMYLIDGVTTLYKEDILNLVDNPEEWENTTDFSDCDIYELEDSLPSEYEIICADEDYVIVEHYR